MRSGYYTSVSSLIISGEDYFTLYFKETQIKISLFDVSTLTDTISLVCGDSTGLTYCGNRELVIWDNKRNQLHTLTGSNLFSLSGNILTI